jgi:hypothetical protein
VNEAPLGKAGRNVDQSTIRLADAQAPREEAEASHDGSIRPASGTLIHPDPVGVSNVPKSGINVPSAAEPWSLLHLDHARAVAQSNGRYKGRRVAITRNDLERHLTGEVTLALTVLHYKRALFVLLDVDVCFRDLLSDVGKAALAIGGEDLCAAIFCTSGSDAGRGKVIVTFTQPVAARDGRKLAQHLCRRVRASQPAQSLQRNELSAYPTEKSGGLVRVLGRNPRRGGSIEVAFSLDGEPRLSHLRPLTPNRIAQIVARLGESIAPWVKRRLEQPWLRSEGGNRHFGRMVALAREAIRIRGSTRGLRLYDEWLEKIRANSPELSLPSQKTRDPRNVLDHARKRAWELASKRPSSWDPPELSMRKGIPRGLVRLCNALVSFVREKGLRPSSFGIDYERVAQLIDSSKSTAYRWVQRAENLGLVVIHDRGSRHTRGAPGQCTRLGLVCSGQTKEQVRAAGAASNLIRERKERRTKQTTGNGVKPL